jgi:hypothetical protein
MTELSEAITSSIIGKNGLVGCAVKCSPKTARFGTDTLLDNLCRRARANLGWGNLHYVDTPGKLDPQLISQLYANIPSLFNLLLQKKHVVYRLRLDDDLVTSAEVMAFWAELQHIFQTQMKPHLGKLNYVFLIVMGSSPSEIYPPEANIRFLGEFNLQRSHLIAWMYNVLKTKSHDWSDPQWNNAIIEPWANLIIKKSQYEDELNFQFVDQHLKTSLGILDNYNDGASFLLALTDAFNY